MTSKRHLLAGLSTMTSLAIGLGACRGDGEVGVWECSSDAACPGSSSTGLGATTSTDTGSTAATTATASSSDESTADTGPTVFDVGGGDPPEACEFDGGLDAKLRGTVVGPDGSMPISGAAVYLTDTPPDPIPQTVYCSTCVELDCATQRWTTSAADGSFALSVASGADRYLVVRKGDFMRVTDLDVVPGDTELAPSVTSLPDRNAPDEGLYIPRIALASVGSDDNLAAMLAKMGLGGLQIDTLAGAQLIPGTESFDFWNNTTSVPSFPGPQYSMQGEFDQLVSDYAELSQYHIVFMPCTHDELTHVDVLSDPAVVDNIRNWVAAGGRWYAIDFSNNWIDEPFAQYQEFYVETQSVRVPGKNGLPEIVEVESLDPMGSYDSTAEVLDDGMLDWLDALPDEYRDINALNYANDLGGYLPTLFELPKVRTIWNFAGLQGPPPEVLVPDGSGGSVNVGHKVWLEGPGGNVTIPDDDIHPLAVTGQYGCGKIQYTSYHGSGYQNYTHLGLLPQELTLIYTILELGVCQQPLPTPEG